MQSYNYTAILLHFFYAQCGNRCAAALAGDCAGAGGRLVVFNVPPVFGIKGFGVGLRDDLVRVPRA